MGLRQRGLECAKGMSLEVLDSRVWNRGGGVWYQKHVGWKAAAAALDLMMGLIKPTSSIIE